jgi:hypothetical protein
MGESGEAGAFIEDTQCVLDPAERLATDGRAGCSAAKDGQWYALSSTECKRA